MTLMSPSECWPDDCQFPIIVVGDDYKDPDGILLPGMEVLGPCENCGLTANEYSAYVEGELAASQKALTQNIEHKNISLFHWSPAKNRNQIVRYGLLPGRRRTTHSDVLGSNWRAPYVCFATDPAWAWALSGMMKHSPDGEWDLWQTWWEELTEPEILPSEYGDGIHEVRTYHRVYKRSVKYLGSRTKL